MQNEDKGYTGYKTIGSKYDKALDVKEIAARIRTDIKSLIKANVLPQGTYSVTIQRYSGGQSIAIRIKSFEFPILNKEKELRDANRENTNDFHYPRYTKIAQLVLEELNQMLNSFRYDDSDGMIDYFDTNFYGNASFDWELEAKERSEILKTK
jgi:hypothetical protein